MLFHRWSYKGFVQSITKFPGSEDWCLWFMGSLRDSFLKEQNKKPGWSCFNTNLVQCHLVAWIESDFS